MRLSERKSAAPGEIRAPGLLVRTSFEQSATHGARVETRSKHCTVRPFAFPPGMTIAKAGFQASNQPGAPAGTQAFLMDGLQVMSDRAD